MLTLNQFLALTADKVIIIRRSAKIGTVEDGLYYAEDFVTYDEIMNSTVKRIFNNYYSENCICVQI